MNTRSILTTIILIGAGYLIFSSVQLKKKIEELRARLNYYDMNTPSRSDRNNWINWIQTALDWTKANKMKLEDLWSQGGAFFNKKSAPSRDDVDLLMADKEVEFDV